MLKNTAKNNLLSSCLSYLFTEIIGMYHAEVVRTFKIFMDGLERNTWIKHLPLKD